MRTKAMSPNNKTGRHQTTQNRVMPPKCLKGKGASKKMKATQHRIVGKAIPGTSNAYTMKLSSNCMKQVPQSRGLGQLDFTPPLKHHRIYPTWIELKPV
jgi:hypothetical protein